MSKLDQNKAFFVDDPSGFTLGSGEVAPVFATVEKDVTAAEETDFLDRKIAIDTTDPGGPNLSVHVDDQVKIFIGTGQP